MKQKITKKINKKKYSANIPTSCFFLNATIEHLLSMLFLTLPLNSVLNRHANFDLHNEKTGVKNDKPFCG